LISEFFFFFFEKKFQTREPKFHDKLIPSNIMVYIEDVLSHIASMLQITSTLHETLDRAHSTYLSQGSLEYAEMATKMDNTARKVSF